MQSHPMHPSTGKASLAEERGLALSTFRSQARRRSRRGASMIELVLTISIIAVLGVIAVPRFNETRVRHRDENTARTIHRATAFATAEARRRTATVTIRFNASNELLSITAEADGNTTAVPWRGSVAGATNQGGETVAWTIAIDPHGQAVVTNMPTNTALIASLKASSATGSKKLGLSP